MANDWKLCADWLVRCHILAPEHPAAKATGQLQNLAAVLRDGVLICMLLNRLHPGAIDFKEYSSHPQVSLFLCKKNVNSFLRACKTVFELKDRDLFEPCDLVESAGFGKVIHTLSKLSQSPLALKTGIVPFEVNEHNCNTQSEYMNPFGFSRDDDEEDSDEDDYCNYSLPSVASHDDVYCKLVDLKPSLSPTTKDSKTKKDLCIEELVNTEGKFVAALQMIREKFMASLTSVMAPNDFDIVFRDIEQLHSVHSHFHQQLCKAVSKEGNVTIGECFLTCKEKFIVHGDYCSNLLDAQVLIDKLSANNASFNARLTQCQMAANDAKFKLRDLLALPMQRVLKYHLFLKELLKQMKNEDTEKRSLQFALKEIEDLSLFVNEVKRDNETLMAIRSLQKSIVGLTLPNNVEMLEYGRLVIDGELKVKCDGETSQNTRHVFLLDKLVLICKSAGEMHRFKKFLPLIDYQLDDTSSTGKSAMSFLLKKGSQSSFLFTAKTLDLRRKWVNAINMAKDNVCPKFARDGGHDFIMQSFNRPTICDVCRKLLRGVFYQGYKCRNTGMAVHKECLEKAKDMRGPPTLPGPTVRRVSLSPAQNVHDGCSPPAPCGSSRSGRSHSMADIAIHGLPPPTSARPSRATSMTAEDLHDMRARNAAVASDVNESASWYAGPMSREDAEAVLQHRNNGTFLIRQSINPSRRGELTLSVKYNTVCHTIIQQTCGRVFFKKDLAFSSIAHLVDHYHRNTLQTVYKEVETPLLYPFKETAKRLQRRTSQNFIGYCRAIYNFAPRAPNQISMREGDIIGIISKGGEGQGWWKGRNDTQVGYFPYAYVTDEDQSDY